MAIDSIDHFSVTDERTLLGEMANGFCIPLSPEHIDSITFELPDTVETKDHYRVFQLFVFTSNGQEISSKDYYIPCYVALNADGSYDNRFVSGQIRGRGNSTWEWYDKKPYRLKLDHKQKLLGMGKAKNWVLLANYRDVTDLMNTFVFELGRWMGLPFTNHTRYVELFINNQYGGLYQLTEQVQQGSSRVDVSDERGILLTLDVDDGPNNNPNATNNFWTKGFNMPAAVKFPENEQLTKMRRDSIRDVFAILEDAIKHKDFAAADSLLDMESFVRYLLIQELVYNVELSAPRSIFLHKDGDGKWIMGPLWDFDGGFDFDWSNMYTGHTFFTDYRETVMGSNPVKRNGNYPSTPQFFTNLFGCKEFVQLYKKTWNHYADSLIDHTWAEMEKYLVHLRKGAMRREDSQWPVSRMNFESEVKKLHTWLVNRVGFMHQLVNSIPDPEDTEPVVDEQLCGTIDVNVTMQRSKGYSQTNTVDVNRAAVLNLLGVSEESFNPSLVTIVPLNTDGTEGQNNTNGVFGGWFNEDGNPRVWDGGHVYIEIFQDLFSWNCGLRQDTCFDEAHVVTMQIQYQVEKTLRKVNIRVHFTIEEDGGWWW